MNSKDIELTELDTIKNDNIVDARMLAEALDSVSSRAQDELCSLNNNIREFLKYFHTRNKGNVSATNSQESKLDNLLTSSISRVITETIPLYPQDHDISEFILSMGIQPVTNFFIMKTDCIELITQQHILNYIAQSGKTDDVKIMKISGDRIPEIEKSLTIKDAVKLMEEKHCSCLLVKLTDSEKKIYEHSKVVHYPKVVTQNQINLLLMQTLIEGGYINKDEPHKHVKKIRTALDDLEEEERNDMQEDKEELDIDNQLTPVKSSKSLASNQASTTSSPHLLSKDGHELELSKRKFQRFIRRFLLKLVNNICVVLIMCLMQFADIVLCFLFLSDIYNYFTGKLFVIVNIFFIAEALLNILGDSWSTSYGKRRILINSVDIVVMAISFIYYFFTFTNERWCRTVGCIIVLLRFVRAYKFIIYQKTTISDYFRKSLNRSRNRLGDTSLDMSFITRNIIAMSWPGSTFDSIWRNNIHDVESYLNTKFGGNYWVINLCAERQYQKTDAKPFSNRFTKYSIRDHNACSLTQICTIVDQCQEWFSQDSRNVVAIHCKGGKGRTGMIVSCLLLKMGQLVRPEDALDLFAEKRTTANKNKHIKEQRVSSPSQNRYVFYYHHILTNGMPPRKPLRITHLIVPDFYGSTSRYQYCIRIYDIQYSCQQENLSTSNRNSMSMSLLFKQYEESEVQLTSHEKWVLKYEVPLYPSSNGEARVSCLDDETSILIDGDVRMEVVVVGSMNSTLGFVWFNTAFVTERDFYFNQEEIDDCSASVNRKLYIHMLVEGNGLNGTADFSKVPSIIIQDKKSITPLIESPSSNSISSRTPTPPLSKIPSRAGSIEGVTFRSNRISRTNSKKKQTSISDLELLERAKRECERTKEEQALQESLFASLSYEDRMKMERFREMCEEANDIFKSIRMSERAALQLSELDFSKIPTDLPPLESDGNQNKLELIEESYEGNNEDENPIDHVELDGLNISISEEINLESDLFLSNQGGDDDLTSSHKQSSPRTNPKRLFGFKSILPNPEEDDDLFISGNSTGARISPKLMSMELVSIASVSSDTNSCVY